MRTKRHRQRSRTYYLSSFMFATPTWKEGVGRLFDFGDALTEYNVRPTPDEADLFAMWLDWRAVGEDVQRALEKFASQFGDRSERPPKMARQRWDWDLLVQNVESLRQGVELPSPRAWGLAPRRTETSQRGSKRPGVR
jgi:hypothetical protein